MTIVWGLEPTGPNEWSGSIVDPNDRTIYRLSAVFDPDGTLHGVFRGIPMVGKTEILTRVDLSIACWALLMIMAKPRGAMKLASCSIVSVP
jgi:hypothetical protein